MKFNATSAAGACIIVGIGGFLLGKITGGSSEKSEAETLLATSERLIEQRRSGSGETSGNRSATSRNRPIRPSANLSDSTFEEKLASMEQIVRGENALDRGRAMLDWIDSLAPEEFENAVARFRSLGLTQARMGEYAMLLTAWAEVDPMSALAYTTENTRGGMATGTVLSAWAIRDPEAAIAWAETNHEGEDANPYMAGIVRSLVQTNPTRATEILQEMPFSRERGETLEAMMPHLLTLGPESAKSWIAALSDDRLRDGAIARFAEQMAKDDPSGTASWLLANLGDASTGRVDEVYEEWAKQDMSAAKNSFEGLPPGDARSRALRGLVTIEARDNPTVAAELMNTYPDDIDDRMVLHFVWNSFDKAPEVAMGQVALIEDQRRRDRMYSRALDSWLERDQSAAQRWINSANLSESVRKSLPKTNTP